MELDKRLALNKTRVRKLREMLGDDTDEWLGKAISLYPIDVTMNGKQVGSVAVGPVPKKKSKLTSQVADAEDPDVLFGDDKK
jgi:hypothetical protein